MDTIILAFSDKVTRATSTALGRQRQFGAHARFPAQAFENCVNGSDRNGRQARMSGEWWRCGGFQKDCHRRAASIRCGRVCRRIALIRIPDRRAALRHKSPAVFLANCRA